MAILALDRLVAVAPLPAGSEVKLLSRFFMAITVGLRMITGLAVLVLLARGLGPKVYGLVATIFAYATLASLLTDFGFASKTLRDIAANRQKGGEILDNSLSVKIYLTIMVLSIGVVVILILPISTSMKLSAMMLSSGVLISAIGDLTLTAYRAVGKFSTETYITGSASILHMSLLGVSALLKADLLFVSCAFLTSRMIYATGAVYFSRRIFGRLQFSPANVRNTLKTIRSAWTWAADTGLNYINGQIDTLIVSQVLGLTATGFYQAASRLIQAFLMLSSILAGVFLPRIAAASSGNEPLSKVIRRPLVEYSVAATLMGLGTIVAGPLFQHFLLGEKYAAVNQLWPGFAVFLFFRYLAGAFGVVLMGYGEAVFRVAGQSVTTVFILAAIPIVAVRGISAMPWVMAAGAAINVIVYGIAVMRLSAKRSTINALGE